MRILIEVMVVDFTIGYLVIIISHITASATAQLCGYLQLVGSGEMKKKLKN